MGVRRPNPEVGGVGNMEARVGTLAVGTRIITLLTGRSGVVRAHRSSGTPEAETDVQFEDRMKWISSETRVQAE